ncbi:MAG TPA: FG-GAP-like repeat-containing protein [Gemmataceae bacterium]|nr:FG-GAP-like repeat-containing protein [Gemmataceae bacterium]
MDLDGDGHADILSGSWPGELYLFRGLGKGKFAPGEQLKDSDGKVIKLGSASTAFAVDWNGDGKLDLLIGNIEGQVYFVPNEATGKGYAFGKPQLLKVNGEPIRVSHGDSHPIAVDWEKDGKPGLMVGTGAGSVLWYRNVGTRTEPKLALPQTLVAESALNKDWNLGLKEGQWGVRAKICVVDWNGDGWPDLLVGDFGTSRGPEPKLSDADREAHKKAQQKQAELSRQLGSLFQQRQGLLKGKPGETPEAAEQRQKELRALQERIDRMQRELQETFQTLQRFQAPVQYTGNVWLFLRTPPQNGKTSP